MPRSVLSQLERVCYHPNWMHSISESAFSSFGQVACQSLPFQLDLYTFLIVATFQFSWIHVVNKIFLEACCKLLPL